MNRKLTNFKLALLNVQSLNTGWDELIRTMQVREPDVLCVTETRLNERTVLKHYDIPGYRLHHRPRASGRSREGGGVAFYTRDHLRIRKIPLPSSDLEQMWIEVRVSKYKMAICVFYRPPRFGFGSCLEQLGDSLSTVAPQYDYVFVAGDINANLLDVHECRSRDFSVLMTENGMHLTNRDPTRITSTTRTLLDVIYCSEGIDAQSVAVYHNDDLSDHGFVLAQFPIRAQKPPPRVVTYRPLNSFDSETYRFASSVTPWEWVLWYEDVQDMVYCFNFLILGIFDHFAPKRTRVFRAPPAPWVTDSIKAVMRDRDVACSKAKAATCVRDTNLYKMLRNTCTDLIRSEKYHYFAHRINNSCKNSRKLWAEINSVLGKSKQNMIPPHIRNPNVINKTFLETLPNNDVSVPSRVAAFLPNLASFGFRTYTPTEILKIINSITSNASGCDGITIQMIKLTLPHSLEAITAIINTSLQTGTFPESWKVTIIRPIPKKTNIESVNDLRPIGLIPVLSKILEKVVNAQLLALMEQNSIFPLHQSGFRKQHSTTTALMHVVDDVLTASNENLATILVLLDYSRAFDCLVRNTLINKLETVGCDDVIRSWFRSYFENRTQMVECTDEKGACVRSSALPVKRGVIQGSILGPTLYTIYTYDLLQKIKYSRAHMYADDTQIYVHTNPDPSSIGRAIEILNKDLSTICDWSQQNGLALNAQKCSYIVLGTKFQVKKVQETNPTINVNNHPVAESLEVRNLGLLIDGNLNFKKHVDSKVPMCYGALKSLYKLRPFLSTEVRRKLTDALVLSIVDYGDLVYGPCLYKKTVQKIQRIQNSCIRFCYVVPPRSHVTPFLNTFNILNMANRRNLKLNSFLHNLRKCSKPVYLATKLNWSDRGGSYARPNRFPRLQLRIQPRLTAFRGSFRFAASKCWNDLPPPVKTEKSLHTFKRKCKEWLLQQQKSSCCWSVVER